MTGHVYAIRNEQGNVKIGWAKDPFRRLAELNVPFDNYLTLVGYAEGTKEHEAAIHTILAAARLRGEWFDGKHPHVRLFLELLPVAKQPRQKNRAVHPLVKHRKARRISQSALASQIGVTKATISKAESGKQPPSAKLALRIEAATGVPRAEIRPDIFGDVLAGAAP